MAVDPNDELGRKRVERDRARRAPQPGAIGDDPAVTDQEAAIARARESLALSRPASEEDNDFDAPGLPERRDS